MSRVWLLLDCNYLAYRAFYSTGALKYNGEWTGVTFGFLREIQVLMAEHATKNLAFCFDHGKNRRLEIYPEYKQNRKGKYKQMSVGEKEAIAGMKRQVERIKCEHLPALGYENIFYVDGLEADDLIAACVQNLPKKDKALIVSADKDLWQCLSPRVSAWNPQTKKCLTYDDFCRKNKCTPDQWPQIKAIAGDVGDNIFSMNGVGIKKATKFVTDKFSHGHVERGRILKFTKTPQYVINLQLVTLPYGGKCPVTLHTNEKVSPRKWNELTYQLGARSLRTAEPSKNKTGLKLKIKKGKK